MEISAVALLLASAISAVAATSPFVVASKDFKKILGSTPKLTVVFNESLPLFHEAGIYHPPSDSMFFTSERFHDPSVNNDTEGQYVVHITDIAYTPSFKVLPDLPMADPISGARYMFDGADKIIWATLGNREQDPPGGIFSMDPYPPFEVTSLTTSYGDYPYDGPDDVTVTPDGSIYFTDLIYGSLEGLKPDPVLPSQVYRYDPRTNTTRAVADQFTRPNGITHSPDGSVIYVGDTGANVGDGTLDYTAQRSIYALTTKKYAGTGPFLTDHRMFAMPYTGAVDGLKTDTEGNVWGLSTDGLHVWDASGNFLGKILIEDEGNGGNFGFGRPGELYITGTNVLFKLEVSRSVVGTGVYAEA